MQDLEIEVYIRCDSDPYGVDKIFAHLRIGGETVHREQYYAVEVSQHAADYSG